MPLFFRLLFVSVLYASCNSNTKTTIETADEKPQDTAEVVKPDNSNTFYQYSVWFAFVNKVFDGDLTVKELKEHGDVGLGSFDMLDGELVMLDGVPYRVRENGEISEGADTDQIVYADAAFFNEEGNFPTKENIEFKDLASILDSEKKSQHYFYVYKIHGNLKRIKLGGVPKVKPPFKDGLDVLIPNRPVFEAENISGTLVGFYCPDFIGNINAKGHHFHFISDDKKWGGHVMDFQSDGTLNVQWDQKERYQFDLPSNEVFENVKLENEFQYN